MLQQSVPLREGWNQSLRGLTLSEATASCLILESSKSCDQRQKCTTSSCSFAECWTCNNILMVENMTGCRVSRRSNQMISCFLSHVNCCLWPYITRLKVYIQFRLWSILLLLFLFYFSNYFCFFTFFRKLQTLLRCTAGVGQSQALHLHADTVLFPPVKKFKDLGAWIFLFVIFQVCRDILLNTTSVAQSRRCPTLQNG